MQQIAPEDQAGKQRVDKLVQVQRRDGQRAWVLIHVEIQSQRDPAFARRMFRYHARLVDRDDIPVVSLAILGDRDVRWQPTQFAHSLWGCNLSLQFPIVKLLLLDEATLEVPQNPFATLVLLHRDAQETRGKPAERYRRKLVRFRRLLQLGYSASDVRILFRVMEHLLRLPAEFALQARTAMRQIEQQELGMDTFITSIEEIGRKEGRQEGRKEGRQEIVLRLLTRKLVSLPPAVKERIEQLTANQLLKLSDALLDFQTQDDLTNWLDRVKT